MKKIVILMGIPGSGKGTQATILAEHYGYGHISTGNLLRELAADPNGDAEDKAKLEAMKAGGLVDSSLIYKLTFAAIKKELAAGKGVVLDGAIRSVEQAKAYEAFFEEEGLEKDVRVIEIAVQDDVGIDRILTRRKHAEAGTVVPSVAASTLGKSGVAKADAVRGDDTEEVLKKRMQDQGNSVLQPILSYYEELGQLVRIDGERSIDEVDREVREAMERA